MRSKLQVLMTQKTLTVGKALLNLDRALARIDDFLTTDCSWVSVEGEANASAAMVKIRSAYTKIDGDKGNNNPIPGCRGILAVSPRVIAAAHRVNEAKIGLRVACAGLRGASRVKRLDADGRLSPVYISNSRLLLPALGRPNLNMFAAYRKIPILAGIPQRVSFGNWHSYSVQPIARETLADKLRRRHDADCFEDLRKVDRLPIGETTLAQRNKSRLYPLVGVRFEGFNGLGRSYENMSTVVPILYPAAGVAPVVLYGGPTIGPRKGRSDRKICPQQYLQTMRVHRYLRFMNDVDRDDSSGSVCRSV